DPRCHEVEMHCKKLHRTARIETCFFPIAICMLSTTTRPLPITFHACLLIPINAPCHEPSNMKCTAKSSTTQLESRLAAFRSQSACSAPPQGRFQSHSMLAYSFQSMHHVMSHQI